MDSKSQHKFPPGRQASLTPEREDFSGVFSVSAALDPGIRLMYLVNEGDLDAIRELLGSGTDVNFRDIDGRTALHVAACQGMTDVVQLLLDSGAEVDPEDRWGSTVITLGFCCLLQLLC